MEDEEPESLIVIKWLRESFSLREISNLSGLSYSTLYRMYKGKETERTKKMLAVVVEELEYDYDQESGTY